MEAIHWSSLPCGTGASCWPSICEEVGAFSAQGNSTTCHTEGASTLLNIFSSAQDTCMLVYAPPSRRSMPFSPLSKR